MMNKISINILCALIIGILATSLILPAISMGKSFVDGFTLGWDNPDDSELYNYTPVSVRLDDSEFQKAQFNKPDNSLTFDNGEQLHFIPTSGYIMISDKNISFGVLLMEVICYLGCAVFLILFVIEFIKFMIDINKGRIFESCNVRHLTKVSIYLIIISLMEILAGASSDILLSQDPLRIAGHSISADWRMPWSDLILGLVSLLIAKIWQKGIEMEDERKLTI